MSKDSDKSEPSMDDILASIRRIIDEDGSKTRKPAAAAGGKSPSDILDLTEMVNDDGSVTSLEKQSAAASAPSKLIDDDEPPIYADRGDRDRPAASDTFRPILAGDPRAPNAPQPAVERPAPATPPAPPRQPQSPPAAAPAAPPAAPPAASPAQAQPMPPQPPRITPSSPFGGPISLTPVTTPSPAAAQSGLVSNQAANAATAAFDRLAQAALQQQPQAAPPPPPRAPSPTVGGRALEDMVGEMLKPMLQQWLDTNLPSIVERLVQQEIQKMSKR